MCTCRDPGEHCITSVDSSLAEAAKVYIHSPLHDPARFG